MNGRVGRFYLQGLTSKGFGWRMDQGRVQQDAHELNRLLIDRLERDLGKSKINSGLVSALYEGDLANQVRVFSDSTAFRSPTRGQRFVSWIVGGSSC